MIIHQEPQSFSPVYNDLVSVVSSVNTIQPNFKYVYDLYDASDLVNRLARIKQIPRPDGYGVFDCKRLLQSYLTSDINPNETGFKQNLNSFIGAQIMFGEEYGPDPTVFPANASGTVFYAFNGGLDISDFPDYLSTNYKLPTGLLSPLTHEVATGQNLYIYFFAPTTVNFARITQGGVTYDITNTFTASNQHLRLGIGPQNVSGTVLITGDYTVQLFNNSTGAASPIVSVTFDTLCGKYSNYRLQFLNKLGAYDAFNFNLVSKKTESYERKTFDKYRGELTGTSWGYSSMDRGRTQFDTKVKVKRRITSDWITEAQASRLAELMSSPSVYLEVDSTTFIPVIISNENYEIKTKDYSKLINIELDIELNDERRQSIY